MPWLPRPASGEQEAALCKLIANWSATWMSAVPALHCVPMPRSAVGAVRWHGPPAMRVGVRDGTEIALGYAACAGRAELANPRDRDLLKRIGTDMVQNLAVFVTDTIGVGLAEWGDGLPDTCLRLSTRDDAWSLVLAGRPDGFVRLRQEAAGRKRHLAFGKMADALADSPVALGCHLGEAVLSTAQIESLSVGDLIVLDHMLDAALPLMVARDKVAGSARIGSDDGAITMTIVDPISFSRKGS